MGQGKNDYETPPDFYRRLHDEFRFNLDAAALPITAKCRQFITREQNTLSQVFERKRIWLNPPYNDRQYPISEWVRWAHLHSTVHNSLVVMLIPSATDTAYWHDYILQSASEVRNVKGRLHFLLDGEPQTGPRGCHSVIVFRPGVHGAQLSSMEARL